MTLSSSFNLPKLDFSTFHFPELDVLDILKGNGQPNKNVSAFIESSFFGATITHGNPLLKLMMLDALLITPLKEKPLEYTFGVAMGVSGAALIKFVPHPLAKVFGGVLLLGGIFFAGKTIIEAREASDKDDILSIWFGI